MTCIVGYVDKKNKRVLIGGDSAGVAGLDITIRKDPKVFKVGDFVIGFTSSFRMGQLLRFSFTPPEIKKKDIYEYMCTDFIDAVRECFKNGGYLQKYQSGDERGGQFLVGYQSRLFVIDNDFQVGENYCGYNAKGCGDSYALGAIHVLNQYSRSPEEIVRKALDAATEFSAGVAKPYTIVSTK